MSMTPEQERKLDRLGWDIRGMKEDTIRIEATLEDHRRDVKDVKDKQREDHEAFNKYVAVAEAATKAAKEIAEKTVTSKQLYISFAATFVALGGLIVGALGFLHA